jgi:hypothetical protein
MARSWSRRLFFVLAGLTASALPHAADARVDGNSSYSKAQTYSAALRYVRVDRGYEVLEKDPEAAYLIFKYSIPGGPKEPVTGTLEVVEAAGGVRLFVSLPRVPEYQERIFRDGLLKKLREEYGAPPPPVTKKPEKPEKSEKSGDGGEAPPKG